VRVRLVTAFGWCLLAALIAFSIVRRQWDSDGHDFQAFHSAATRWVHGENPYVATDAYPYKYAPPVLLVFAPFGLMDLSSAQRLYSLVTLLAVLAVPFFSLRILRRDAGLSPIQGLRWLGAGGLGMLASLRFLDNEFHSVNANVLALALMLAGYSALVTTAPRALGALGVTIGSFFKFHPFFALGLFLNPRSWKSVVFWIAAIFLVALLPDPRLWLELTRQLRETRLDFLIDGRSNPMQGFYPLGVLAFGWARDSLAPALLFAPLALAALVLAPKFDLWRPGERPSDRPAAFLLASLSLLTLAATISPLPWHHTYVLFWAAVPVSWICASRGERPYLLILVAILALTPRGIAGRSLADALERSQIVLWVALAQAALLMAQARRLVHRRQKSAGM